MIYVKLLSERYQEDHYQLIYEEFQKSKHFSSLEACFRKSKTPFAALKLEFIKLLRFSDYYDVNSLKERIPDSREWILERIVLAHKVFCIY
jgi:hypothetical protein